MSARRDEISSSYFSTLADPDTRKLASPEGELVLVRASVVPQLLEEFLEALAELPFPVNPQIHHYRGDGALTVVEFPAYHSWLPRVRSGLRAAGFASEAVEVTSMLDAIQS